jgi:tetratricopeptide (TPR) repeat protein
MEHDRMILADTEQRRGDAAEHAKTAAQFLTRLESRGKQGPPLHLDGFLRTGGGAEPEMARIVGVYGNIALTYVNLHLYAEGARYARRAVEITRSLPPGPAVQGRVQGLSVLANALRYQGDLDGALATIREAREVLETGTYPSDTIRFFTRYGVLMREGLILGEADAVSLNRPDDAIRVFEEALALCEDAAHQQANETASRGREGTVARELGEVLTDRDPKRAVAIFDLGIQRLIEAGNGLVTRRERAVLLALSSYPLRRLNREAEAKTRIESALTILKGTGDDVNSRLRLGSEGWIATCALADNEAARDPGRGLAIYEQLLAAVMANKPKADIDLRDAPKLSHMYAALSSLYVHTGDPVQAAAMKARRIELWNHWSAALPKNAFVRSQLEAARLGAQPL